MFKHSTIGLVLPLILILFLLLSMTVSCDVFKLVGSSVQFDIWNQRYQFEELFWTFNENYTIMIYYEKNRKTKLYSTYKHRVEFNKEVHSLILKDLQKNDSGLYKATASGKQQIEVKYRLYVLDPVETPVLTPVPHQQNNDSCNVTLTCRGHDHTITSSCSNETCEEKEVTSQGNFALSLSVSGNSIICNHSNPASWKKSSMEMNQLKLFCYPEGNINQAKHLHLSWAVPVLSSVVVAIILLALFVAYERLRKKKKTGSLEFDSSVTTVQNKDELPTAFRMLRKSDSPLTVYSTVRKTPQPPTSGKNSHDTTNPELITEQRQIRRKTLSTPPITIYSTVGCSNPETIYTTVNKTRKSAPSLNE